MPRIAQFIDKESYLTPFIGSLYAALQGMETPKPYHDLLALSGAGNRMSWKPGVWFGGNVDILSCEDPPLSPHFRVLKVLGLAAQVRLLRDIEGMKKQEITQEQACLEIVASIDSGIPVIAMGIIGPPECCVVYGYEDNGAALVG